MIKTVIFVEGQTELIFVREYLLRFFNWQVDIVYRQLLTDGKLEDAEFKNPAPKSERHYQIINVGGDTAVLRRLLQREESLRKIGYERIIGLRDMYSEDYLKLSKSIDLTVNQRFVDTFKEAIQTNAKQPGKISFCFAIMETEAWLIGLHEVLLKINKKLGLDLIKSKIGHDLAKDNPEAIFFQPSVTLNQIFELVGESYKKKKGDIESFMNKCSKKDIENLLAKPICNHFNLFHEAVTGN